MEILLKRIARKPKYTIGKLYCDGKYVCDTIEDYDRLYYGKPKVMHETAIPCGRYEVIQSVKSPRLGNKSPYKEVCQGYVPRLKNIPQFEGVLIHCGNYAGFETFLKKIVIDKKKEILTTEEYVEVV